MRVLHAGTCGGGDRSPRAGSRPPTSSRSARRSRATSVGARATRRSWTPSGWQRPRSRRVHGDASADRGVRRRRRRWTTPAPRSPAARSWSMTARSRGSGSGAPPAPARRAARRSRHGRDPGPGQHPPPPVPGAHAFPRAGQTGCSSWLVELYPIWGGLDAEWARVATLVGVAELALSGCTTTTDHHYVFPHGAGRRARGHDRRRRASSGSGSTRPGVDGPGRLAGRAASRRRRARTPTRSSPIREEAVRTFPRPVARRDGPDRRRARAPRSRVSERLMRGVGRARAPARRPAPHASRRDARGGGATAASGTGAGRPS